jgi:hypothetical protein
LEYGWGETLIFVDFCVRALARRTFCVRAVRDKVCYSAAGLPNVTGISSNLCEDIDLSNK